MNPSLESLFLAGGRTAPEGEPSSWVSLLCFILVGGSGALAFVVLSTLAIDIFAGMPKWLLSTACYVTLIGPVYLLHRRFSFQSAAPHRHALPRYVLVQLGAVVLTSIFSFIGYRLLSLEAPLAPLLVTMLTSGVSFAVLKLWAFTHPSEVQPDGVTGALAPVGEARPR